MRKYIPNLILIAAIIALPFLINWFNELNFNPFHNARITEVDYKAVVIDEYGSDGKIIVTERLTFEVNASSRDNLIWELWRDLTEHYEEDVKFEYKVNSVKQVFDGKPQLIYEKSSKLYWDDKDYIDTANGLGPGKWYHSKGPYSEYLRQYECLLIYVDGIYRDTVEFEIEYEVYNATFRYKDSSELYLNIFSESPIRYLNSVKGQILFPNEIMPKPGNYEAYTYGTNAHSFPFNESDSINPGYHTFSFALEKPQLKFRRYNQYISFALLSHGEDKHIFTEFAPANPYSHTNQVLEFNEEQAAYEAIPGTFLMIKILVFLLFLLITLLTLKFAFGLDNKMNREHIFYQPTKQIDYFYEIPSELDPIFAAHLVFCKHETSRDNQDGSGAVMQSLVRKGYIELEKILNERGWDFSNIKIVVKYKPAPPQPIESMGTSFDSEQAPMQEPVIQMPPLTATEELYFNLILRYTYTDEIPMSLFQEKVSQDYDYTDSFVNNIDNSITNIGISQGYFQKSNYKEPKEKESLRASKLRNIGILLITAGNLISYLTRLDLAFGAFFILGAGLIISATHIKELSKKYILLTQFGEDEYAKWRGLYNFLKSDDFGKDRSTLDTNLWEKYLIYATAFGISQKVCPVINIICSETNTHTSPVLRNPYYRSRGFYSFSRSFRRAIHIDGRGRSYGRYGRGGRGGWGGGG